MAWYTYAFSAAGGLLLGTAVAYLNMRLSKRVLGKNDIAIVMGVNVLRLLFDAAALTIVFFVCKAAKLPLGITLISTAVGLTVLGMLFLELMTKKYEKENEESSEGGGVIV